MTLQPGMFLGPYEILGLIDKGGNIILGGPDRYYDSGAFAVPAPGFLGTRTRSTESREIQRGCGPNELDGFGRGHFRHRRHRQQNGHDPRQRQPAVLSPVAVAVNV